MCLKTYENVLNLILISHRNINVQMWVYHINFNLSIIVF